MLSDVTGLLTGLVGFALASAGLLLALLAAIRVLWVLRRPGKGRIARGIAVGGLVLVLCGALLLTVEEVSEARTATDRIAHVLAGASVLVALWAGVWSARRRPATTPLAPAAGASASQEVPREETRGE